MKAIHSLKSLLCNYRLPMMLVLCSLLFASCHTISTTYYHVEVINVTSSLNMRAEPTTSSEVVKSLMPGDEVIPLDTLEAWVNVKHLSSNAKGWVKSDYIGLVPYKYSFKKSFFKSEHNEVITDSDSVAAAKEKQFLTKFETTTREGAVKWLKNLGIIIGSSVLLLICLGLLCKTGIYIFYPLTKALFHILFLFIPWALLAYFICNQECNWFISDANGYGILGFIAWGVVCFIGIFSVMTYRLKPLRKGMIISSIMRFLYYVALGISWGYMLIMTNFILIFKDDFYLLGLCLVILSLGGGAYAGSQSRATMSDYYGHEVEGHIEGDRFYGNDGNTYRRRHDDNYYKD